MTKSSLTEQEKQVQISALRMLAATPKSRKMLETRLLEKGFDPQAVRSVLAGFEKQGLLNDKNYAQALFQSYALQKPSGRRRIIFELEKKGITGSLTEEILEQYSPEEEKKQALELARQRVTRWRSLQRLNRRKKLYDFLVRRGFDFSLSREVVAEVERDPQP